MYNQSVQPSRFGGSAAAAGKAREGAAGLPLLHQTKFMYQITFRANAGNRNEESLGQIPYTQRVRLRREVAHLLKQIDKTLNDTDHA